MARLSVVAAIVGCLVLFGWLWWPGSSAIHGGSRASRIVLIVLILAWFIGWRMADVYLCYLRGEQRFDEFARLSAFSALIKVLAIGLFAWLFGVAGALAGYVVSYLVPASRIWQLLRNRSSDGRQIRRQVLNFALASWWAGVIGGIVFGRTEIVFLEHYAGIVAVGLFAAAAALADTIIQLPALLLSAALPYFSEQRGLGAHDRVHRMYRAVTGIVGLVVMPLCIGIAAIAPVLVPLLFGAEYAGAVPVASVLLIASAIISLGVATSYLVYSTGNVGILLTSHGLGLVGTIALGFILIPRFGLMGAAWSRAVVQVSVVAIETFFVIRRQGFTLPYRALGAITLATVMQGGVAYAISTAVGGIMSLVLAIPAAVLVFVIALRVLAVLPMVDPALVDALVAHAPVRMRRVISSVLKLVSPAAKGRPAPE